MHRLTLLSVLIAGCTLTPQLPPDTGVDDTDTDATDDTGNDTDVDGDGTELVVLGYLGAATVTADSWTGSEALTAEAEDSGTERCRFEWTTSGTPHPQAGACDGCSFAHEVTMQDGHVVGPSCDWLFDTNGAPPEDAGPFGYAFHPSFDDGSGPGPTLLYFYVDRWIPLTTEAAYDAGSDALTYRVVVGEDYF